MAARTCSLVGRGVAASSAVAETICPAVQNPHCRASSSTNARCSADSSPSSPRPWIVVTSQPSACSARRDPGQGTTRPSTSTVQAPHVPSAQAILVPVRPTCSRSNSASVAPSGTLVRRSRPFSVSMTWVIRGPYLPGPR